MEMTREKTFYGEIKDSFINFPLFQKLLMPKPMKKGGEPLKMTLISMEYRGEAKEFDVHGIGLATLYKNIVKPKLEENGIVIKQDNLADLEAGIGENKLTLAVDFAQGPVSYKLLKDLAAEYSIKMTVEYSG